MNLSVSPVSLISSQRTGLRVFDLSEDGRLKEFIDDIKEVLIEVKKECSLIKYMLGTSV